MCIPSRFTTYPAAEVYTGYDEVAMMSSAVYSSLSDRVVNLVLSQSLCRVAHCHMGIN